MMLTPRIIAESPGMRTTENQVEVRFKGTYAKMTMTEETEVFHGSSNVFADLGIPDAEKLLAKAEFARQVAGGC